MNKPTECNNEATACHEGFHYRLYYDKRFSVAKCLTNLSLRDILGFHGAEVQVAILWTVAPCSVATGYQPTKPYITEIGFQLETLPQ